MANIANNDALKFIYLSNGITPENASTHGITIGGSDIVFYSTENKIIVNGIEFGLTSTQKTNLTAAYNQVVTGGTGTIKDKVETLETKVGENNQISKALFQIVQELKSKLDGGSFEGDGSGATINVGDASITNAVAAINKLYELVSNAGANAGVQSVNGLQGVVVLTGSNINTTDAAGNTFKGKSIDAAFAGVQSNIDGIQARIGAEETERQNSVTGIQNRIGAEETLRGQQISGVQTQLSEKIGNLGGTQTTVTAYVDQEAAKALAGAQATAKAYVDGLAGTDWTTAAQTVQDIIDELSEGGKADFTTVVDKVRGDFSYEGAPEGQQSIKGYIDHAVSVGTQGAQGKAGTAETNAKNYTDTKIQALNGVQADTDAADHIYVKVTQAEGKITGVQVDSKDIASASGLQSVQNQLKWVVV